jgi:hypothetical protein
MYFQEVMIKFGQTLPNFGNLNQRSTGRWVMNEKINNRSKIRVWVDVIPKLEQR